MINKKELIKDICKGLTTIADILLSIGIIAAGFVWIVIGTWFLGSNEILQNASRFIQLFFALGIAVGAIWTASNVLNSNFLNLKEENKI